MDEKTEELRDIFLDVADEDTVTDHQDEDRGSLDSDRDVAAELQEVIEEMRTRFAFQTDLDDEKLTELVCEFYDGASDDELAEVLSVDTEDIQDARLDLHLVRPEERDYPFDITEAMNDYSAGEEVAALSERYDVQEDAMRRLLRIHEIDQRSRQVNQRYRDTFDSILEDMELTSRMVSDVHEDGLEDATEGLETNISF